MCIWDRYLSIAPSVSDTSNIPTFLLPPFSLWSLAMILNNLSLLVFSFWFLYFFRYFKTVDRDLTLITLKINQDTKLLRFRLFTQLQNTSRQFKLFQPIWPLYWLNIVAEMWRFYLRKCFWSLHSRSWTFCICLLENFKKYRNIVEYLSHIHI